MTGLGRVLVTGGTGFIGSHIARAILDAGGEPHLLDVAPPNDVACAILGPLEPPVSIGGTDNWSRTLEVVAEVRPRAIVHLAAIGDPAPLHRNPYTALQVNVHGTVNVLEAARLYGVERVVNFSSIGVLPAVQYEPIDVRHPVLLPGEGPGSGAYGASKIAGEAFCFAYRQSYGLDVATIRPSAVYGFGMRHPIYIKPMVEGAVRGERVRLASGGRFPRDYTHVHDLAELTLAVLRVHQLEDRIFYGATGEALVTGSELAAVVREVVPGADIEIADDITESDRLELRYRGRLSIENARAQLGWKPRYGDLRAGVHEYAASFSAFNGTADLTAR